MNQQQAVVRAINLLSAAGIMVKIGELWGNPKSNITLILENVDTEAKEVYTKKQDKNNVSE